MADAWDGKKPGTRPAQESDALYHYMTYPQERYQREKVVSNKQHAESERERQKQMRWFTDEELKKKFGPDLRMAAWQLGARQAANELLYGAENSVNLLRTKLGDKNVPSNRKVPELTPAELSLMARHPWHAELSKLFTNQGFSRSLGQVTKGAEGFKWYESLGVGQAINQVKKQSHPEEQQLMKDGKLKGRVIYNG